VGAEKPLSLMAFWIGRVNDENMFGCISGMFNIRSIIVKDVRVKYGGMIKRNE
jgi:hypothetical protein